MKHNSYYKTKIQIGPLPKGSLVKLKEYPHEIFDTFSYTINSLNKIEGNFISYFYEAASLNELYADFEQVCHKTEVSL